MQLKEFLKQRMEEAPEFEDQVVKIGSQSGYFYCGTVKNFLKNMAEYDGRIRQFFITCVKNAEARYEFTLKNPPTIQDYAKEVLNTPDGWFSIRDYEKKLCGWFKAVRNRYLAVEKAAERKDGTKPLGEREVIDSFTADRAVDEGIEVIKVEGFEQGGLWMACEVEKKGEFTVGEDEKEEDD